MVLVASGYCEVGRKAAAGPRRYALCAQQGAQEKGVFSAAGDDPLFRRAGNGRGTRIQDEGSVEEVLRKGDVPRVVLRRRFRGPVSFEPSVVDDQPLNDLEECPHVVRQPRGEMDVLSETGGFRRRRVEVENVLLHCVIIPFSGVWKAAASRVVPSRTETVSQGRRSFRGASSPVVRAVPRRITAAPPSMPGVTFSPRKTAPQSMPKMGMR